MIAELGVLLAMTGAGGLLAHGAFNPASQLFGATLVRGKSSSKKIAITFDDGPNEPCTAEVLHVLDRYRAPATFFLVGQHVRARPDLVRAIASRGHEIGNHSFSHCNLAWLTRGRIERELAQCGDAIRAVTGVQAKLFRPPYGGRNPAVFSAARSLGLQVVQWSVTAYDWTPQPAARVVDRVLPRAASGDVILLHDGNGRMFGADRSHTVHALPPIIENLQEQGLRLVTVSELFDLSDSPHTSQLEMPSERGISAS